MSQPAISNYFGTNASLETSEVTISPTPEAPALVIYLADFGAVGLNTIEGLDDPDKILAAIIKQVKTFTDADTTEDPGVEIANPQKAFTTRNNNAAIAVSYDIAFFVPDPTGSSIDPDEVL